jgi:hypothetical protein
MDHGMRNHRFMLKFSNACCRHYDESCYAGSHRGDLLPLMLPHIADDGVSMEIVSLSALALCFVFVGSVNGEVARTILQTSMEDKFLDEKWAMFTALGLVFLSFGAFVYDVCLFRCID